MGAFASGAARGGFEAQPLSVGDRVRLRGLGFCVEALVLGVGTPEALPVAPGFEVELVGEELEALGVDFVAVVSYEHMFLRGRREVASAVLRQVSGRWCDLRQNWLLVFRYSGAGAVSDWEEVH
jgi:hypothetical protein